MSVSSNLSHIPTLRHIRTMRSIPTNTGPGRGRWLRLQETEQQRWEQERLVARRRLHERWQAIQRLPNIRWRLK